MAGAVEAARYRVWRCEHHMTKSSQVRESSSEEEEIISPAYNKRNTAVFPNFAYEDKLGEQHWDLS